MSVTATTEEGTTVIDRRYRCILRLTTAATRRVMATSQHPGAYARGYGDF
jgi:hypothetical protein